MISLSNLYEIVKKIKKPMIYNYIDEKYAAVGA